MTVIQKDLGGIDAYAIAVDGGYTGTRAQFAEAQAQIATTATSAAASATSAANSATAAAASATTAQNSATWAEGSDSAVEALGGTHSAKGWANSIALPAASASDALKVPAVTSAGAYALEHRVKDVTMGGVSLVGSDDIAVLDNAFPYVYGIDIDTEDPSPSGACQRVLLNHGLDSDGVDASLKLLNVSSFSAMPCHNLRRCVMDDLATRHVNYYLSAADSNYKSDGVTASVLTGADGDVMVEFPVAYWRIDSYTDSDNHLHNVYLLSPSPFRNSHPHPFFYVSPGGETCRTQYVGAFRDVLCNADGTVKAQGAGTSPASYASGNKYRSIAGARPASNVSRATFRTGSIANGGTNVNTLAHMYIGLLMVVEYATLDTQAGFSCGYTNLSSFVYKSMRNTGRTASFGNGSGSVLADDSDETGADYDLLSMGSGGASLWSSSVTASTKVVQCSYRGIEDPFGSQWCFEDGIQKLQNASDFTQSGYYYTTDTSSYTMVDTAQSAGEDGVAFPEQGYTGEGLQWVSHHWPKSAYYVKGYEKHTFLPLQAGGSSTTYLADYHWNNAAAGACVVYRGGYASDGVKAGMWFVYVLSGLTAASVSLGCRLAA